MFDPDRNDDDDDDQPRYRRRRDDDNYDPADHEPCPLSAWEMDAIADGYFAARLRDPR